MEFPQVTGSELMVWLGCLFLLMLVLNEAFKLRRNLSGRPEAAPPQPFVVSPAVEYATKKELDAVKDDLERVGDDLKHFRDEVRANGETRRKSIEGKVEGVRTEVTAHIESVRKELAEDIKNMPDRVIATLRNTGAIK